MRRTKAPNAIRSRVKNAVTAASRCHDKRRPNQRASSSSIAHTIALILERENCQKIGAEVIDETGIGYWALRPQVAGELTTTILFYGLRSSSAWRHDPPALQRASRHTLVHPRLHAQPSQMQRTRHQRQTNSWLRCGSVGTHDDVAGASWAGVTGTMANMPAL